ncbi:cellulose binding domain-containing protein [Streptosporangium sp. NPDC023825]|uniref:cellulose binding domain-containing protein n=1 Tax=Streptosporangium sp. NPDC023825 TaxID=3154909 RepID=UPI00341458D8
MPPTTKIAPLLGLVSLGAAVALVAAACVGRTAEGGHAVAHPPAAPSPNAPASPSVHGDTQASPSVHGDTQASSPSTPVHGTSKRGTTAKASARCRATVTLVESWPGGYRGAATISNTTDQPMRDWYIQWMQPREATFRQSWNGTHMQSGPVAMIHAPAEKPSLPPGETVSDIGFVGAAATPPTFTEITCG